MARQACRLSASPKASVLEDRGAADLKLGHARLTSAAPGNGQLAGAQQRPGGRIVPQRFLFVLVVDLTLGATVSADQQVRAVGASLGLLEELIDVGLAVGGVDQTGFGAQSLDLGGTPVALEPALAFFFLNGSLLARLGLAHFSRIAYPDLDVDQSEGHALWGEGEGVVQFKPLRSRPEFSVGTMG